MGRKQKIVKEVNLFMYAYAYPNPWNALYQVKILNLRHDSGC